MCACVRADGRGVCMFGWRYEGKEKARFSQCKYANRTGGEEEHAKRVRTMSGGGGVAFHHRTKLTCPHCMRRRQPRGTAARHRRCLECRAVQVTAGRKESTYSKKAIFGNPLGSAGGGRTWCSRIRSCLRMASNGVDPLYATTSTSAYSANDSVWY